MVNATNSFLGRGQAAGALGMGAAGAWWYRWQLRSPHALCTLRPIEVATTPHSELCGDRVPGPLDTPAPHVRPDTAGAQKGFAERRAQTSQRPGPGHNSLPTPLLLDGLLPWREAGSDPSTPSPGLVRWWGGPESSTRSAESSSTKKAPLEREGGPKEGQVVVIWGHCRPRKVTGAAAGWGEASLQGGSFSRPPGIWYFPGMR